LEKTNRPHHSGTPVTEQTESTPEKRKPKSAEQTNWPLLRKFETLLFACMLVLLPICAWTVVNITTTSLAVKNSSVDLAKDLNRCKQLAKDGGVNITMVSRRDSVMGPPAYLIQDDQRTIEEVVLPKGVTVDGSVKFNNLGIPDAPAAFTISKGPKKARVVIDATGIISAP
jgi:hypothetical protein